MHIVSIRHKGLKRFIEKNDGSGLPAASTTKLRDIITALLVSRDIDDMSTMPGWRLHPLTGARKGEWSITLTKNWRVTFAVKDHGLYNLNLEDYH